MGVKYNYFKIEGMIYNFYSFIVNFFFYTIRIRKFKFEISNILFKSLTIKPSPTPRLAAQKMKRKENWGGKLTKSTNFPLLGLGKKREKKRKWTENE